MPANSPLERANGLGHGKPTSLGCADDDASDPDSPSPSRVMDLDRIRRAVREILIAVGEDPDREGLRETPDRVAGCTLRSSRACTRIPGCT